MANYTVGTSKDKVPLPSHWDKTEFTLAAFDNFDHDVSTLEGTHGSHDTVSVLFQNKPKTINRKPPISETPVKHGETLH